MPGRRLWPYEVPSTHEAVSSTTSRFRRMQIELVGADELHSALLMMVRRFSAETGGLLAYLRFKFRFVTDWPESEPEPHRLTVRDIEERLARGGTIELRKDDAVFWAAGPRPRGSE